MTNPVAPVPAAVSPDVDVVIIGAGFAGLYAVYRLRELGFSVQGFERGEDVGGVWYWNRYPGARCDCESYYYSYGFSEALQAQWDWPLKYSHQPDILAYLSHVADRFELRPHIRFGAAVERAAFDEGANAWRVSTAAGETVTARFLVSAAGCLSAINRPDIPGLGDFQGQLFYTADWPPQGVDFTGQRVGVIGTGASGVQAIPIIARQAERLTVFQRTANWVIPVWNGPMDADFAAWVKQNHGQMRQRCRDSGGAVPFEVSATRAMDVSEQRRREIFETAWATGGTRFFAQSFCDLLSSQEANDAARAFVAEYIRREVDDPVIAEKLIPGDHPIGTKRPPMDDDYYAAFNRANVELVDLREHPIVTVRPHGLATTAGEHDLDALVLATGFDAITGALSAIDIRGRGGVSLREAWADGARTYLGLAVAGFPNLFTVTGPMSPSVLANMPTAIEQHVDWIGACLAHLRAKGLRRIEAGAPAEADWVEHTAKVASGTLYPKANSWYLGANIPGKPRRFGVYLGGFSAYRARCEAIAAAGYEGFEVA